MRHGFLSKISVMLIFLLFMASFITVGSGASDDTIIGFRWNTSDPSPRLYQINQAGAIIANKDATFWDNWNITGNMKTVVVNATTNTVLYGSNNRGDGLVLSGESGDVMVEIPRFYTCSTYANGNFSYWISPLPETGFTVAPMFNQRGNGNAAGTPAPYYYVGRYDASLVGSTLQSATGKAPAVSMTIGQARTWAEAKGVGWGITNIWTLTGLRQLFYTEMLTLNSQTAWTKSRGVVDYSWSDAPKNSGADSIDTQIYANNATGSGTGDDGKTPVSYRGIENLWGNVWQFQDGFNAIQGTTNVISPTGLGLTGQKTTFKDLMDANDVQSVGALVLTSGYQKNLMNTDVARSLFLPSAVGGSETTYLSDYYYYPSSPTVNAPNILFSGGPWACDGYAGVGELAADDVAPDSSAYVGARVEFRRNTAAAPTFGSINPTTGPIAGGTTVTITGTGFTGATLVTFDGTPATFTVISDTQITATTPAHTAGAANVVITTPNGTATRTSAYTYVEGGGGGGGDGPGPNDSGISGISPGSGTSGTQIQTTITGSNFPTTTKKVGAGTTTIKVWLSQLGEGRIIGKEVNVLSATKLTCTFNLAGAHPGKWTVNAKRNDGFLTAVLTDAFTVKSAPAVPVVRHITPSSVKAGAKAFSLTVTGENFAKGNRVQWKGVAKETTFVSATTLKAKVLATDIAKSGRYVVSVYRPGRDAATSNGVGFTVRK